MDSPAQLFTGRENYLESMIMPVFIQQTNEITRNRIQTPMISTESMYQYYLATEEITNVSLPETLLEILKLAVINNYDFYAV